MLAYRTKGEYWGKERAVIVAFNPKTARKQLYAFESKIETIRQELLAVRAKIRTDAPQWRDPEDIKERYLKRCQQLHISPQFDKLTFEQSEGGLKMRFRKDPYQVNCKQAMLGKNIIITDNMDWSTREIIEAITDRYRCKSGSGTAISTNSSAYARSVTGRTARSGVTCLHAWWPWTISAVLNSGWPKRASTGLLKMLWMICAICTMC